VPVVLVIIILVAWAVILGPSLVKRRARGGGDQSITHFHHQLRILEHSAPEPIVAPAYRLRSVDGSGSASGITYPDSGVRPKLTVVGAKALPRPALAFLGEPAPEPVAAPVADPPRPLDGAGRDDGYGAPATTLDGGARGESFARTRARRRRRDTLSVLAAVFVLTLLAGAVTGASAVLALCALDGVALVAYVALLVHLRRMAVEREHKLHYLDGRDSPRRARAGGPPTHVSGRYAHPSNQQAVAR